MFNDLNKILNKSIRNTYILVVLSKWFIFLHLPYFICWCLFYLYMKKLNSSLLSIDIIFLFKSLLNFFEIVFLFNYSINFFLYYFNGPFFRKRHAKEIFNLMQNLAYCVSRCLQFILR